jgi:tRNA threonylcarbamoyladenosine biosynthesis protein TsaE
MSADAQGSLRTGNWTSENDEETFALGAGTGERLTGGEILLLDGPLGAGKTIFVKGIASALGIFEDEVTSPSFTLVNLYTGRLKLYHLDLYRLSEGAQAAHAVGLEELLTDERAVVVIEWGARLGRYPLPSPVYHVSINGDGDAPREIIISKR